MAYQKKTLRKMQPVTRKYAKLINDLELIVKRSKRIMEELQDIELNSSALINMNKPNPILDDPIIQNDDQPELWPDDSKTDDFRFLRNGEDHRI
ncbi:MAG: hypothetical protein GY845_09635 [Planctomycetes bacterium]|nr:hypothetical protein [Planctomycetota bacterium]